MRSRGYLLLLVFTGGACTLGIELAASNLLAPYFGTSRLIWANVIGLTLLYLTIGYTLGGRFADRHPHLHVLCAIIAVAGLFSAIVPLLAQPILRWSLEAFATYSVGIFFSSLFGVLILFSVPIILLGMVSPFAIRLDVRDINATGRTAGSLYALSTIGSLVGTFLPTLLLTPLVGTSRTIYTFAALLLLISLPGLWATRRSYGLAAAAGLLLTLFLLLSPPGLIKPADCRNCELRYEGESAYNYIQVATRQQPDGQDVYLILNEGKAIHSVYRTAFAESGDPRDLLTNGPWDFFNVAPYFYEGMDPSEVDSMAMVGSAAGTVPKQFLAIYGADSLVDSIEIDPQIVELGREYFAMEDQDPRYPNYETHVEDGRVWLTLYGKQYDIIGMDAYRQPYIPFHLTTREFFEDVRAHLTERGVAVVNAGKPGTDYRLVHVLANTMKAVFPNVYLIDVPSYGNTIVVGTNQPVENGVENFHANYNQMEDPTLRQIMQAARVSDPRKLPVREWTGEGAAFTDDWAPVEWVIDQIIIEQVEQGVE